MEVNWNDEEKEEERGGGKKSESGRGGETYGRDRREGEEGLINGG